MQNRYNKRSNFDELRKNELTSRAGFGWESGEEDKLLSMRLENSSYDDIAVELKRTTRSIQTRIYQYICKLVDNGESTEDEALKKYDVTVDELTDFKSKRDEQFNKIQTRKRTGGGGSGGGRNRDRDDSRPYNSTETRSTNYDIRNELNVLRQEVRELRQEVRELRDRA
jgi:polyhydroxyalkanoate synthesis regulator phasin